MILPLRRKRPTTAPARSTPVRIAPKALALAALLLGAGASTAQQTTVQPPASLPWATIPAADLSIQRTFFQQAQPVPGGAGYVEEKAAEQTIQLEPPGPDRLFRLESEDALKERWRQELKSTRPGDRQIYPEEPILTRESYYGRNWQQRTLFVEPNYLCYQRLLFEQVNMERYGWDLGPLGAVLSPLQFFGDLAILPYHLATDPFRDCECNAGYCLPGDPVPLLLYPPGLSSSGALAETATVLVLLAFVP